MLYPLNTGPCAAQAAQEFGQHLFFMSVHSHRLMLRRHSLNFNRGRQKIEPLGVRGTV